MAFGGKGEGENRQLRRYQATISFAERIKPGMEPFLYIAFLALEACRFLLAQIVKVLCRHRRELDVSFHQKH